MIDTFFMILKKTMFAAVFLVFGFVTVYAPVLYIDDHGNAQVANIEYAHAGGGPVFEVGTNMFTNVANTVEAIDQTLIGRVLNGIVWDIAKQFLSNMISSVIDWVNSGFEGNPAFIQDLDNFLLQAADEAVGIFINELGADYSFVCSPFSLDVQLAVAFAYDLEREDREVECTLTDVINNFEDFIEGDFEEGGWEGWFDLVAEPDSTPYGSVLTARTGARAAILDAEGNEIEKLSWGEGFLSGEFCQNIVGVDGDEEECFITKPGSVIEAQLNEVITYGGESLVEADQINELVSALLGQVAQQAITGTAGLLGLSGGTGYTYSGYSRGSFVDDLADGRIGVGSGDDGDLEFSDLLSDDPGIVAARNLIAEGLTAQATVLEDLGDYQDDLRAFIRNPRNSEDDQTFAQFALEQANAIDVRVSEGVTAATPILEAYNALELEYATADLTRRSEIRIEQSLLITEFNDLGLVTTQEYNAYTAQWDTLLARNVGPLFTGDPCEFGTPDWDPEACFGDLDDVRF